MSTRKNSPLSNVKFYFDLLSSMKSVDSFHGIGLDIAKSALGENLLMAIISKFLAFFII